MSKRGGGGRNSTTGVRAIASVLGIARHEISGYTQIKKEPAELYPPLSRQPLTLETSNELKYMTELKHELLHRFHDSAFFHKKVEKHDVRRYTDKYHALNKETFEPHWERIPTELNWRKGQKKSLKRQKFDDKLVEKKLARLSEKEANGQNEDDLNEADGSDKDDDEEKNKDNDDDADPISDDDYLEEDNDYVQNYFDNGDAYAECSDDNLGDDY